MRAVINKMSLKFESHSVNEAFARQAVGAFVAQLDPTMEELGDIKTVVSEAVTNAIVHGYADKCGFITVTVRLFEGRALELKVKDAGCGIENVEQARQPMFTTGDDTRSGMGFTIMETFTDKMRVRSTPGKGNRKQAEPLADCAPLISMDEGFAAPADADLLQSIRESVLDIDPVYLLFTSGSTGAPKGIVIPHRAVIDFTDCSRAALSAAIRSTA